jgi:hypothetical protein
METVKNIFSFESLLDDLMLIVGIIKEFYYKVTDGCWHSRMSWPKTISGITYRTCLDCGRHRLFDPQSWKMYGKYLYNLPKIEKGAGTIFNSKKNTTISSVHALKQAA